MRPPWNAAGPAASAHETPEGFDVPEPFHWGRTCWQIRVHLELIKDLRFHWFLERGHRLTTVRATKGRFVPIRRPEFDFGRTRLKLGGCCNFPGTFSGLMNHTVDRAETSVNLDFESLVARYYASLYQFAFSLTQAEADACDLTQQTFYIWATKGHQLRDTSKVKSWLFTTLHREFLETRRKQSRFPHYELSQVESDLPTVSPSRVNQLDSGHVLQALGQVDDVYQAPVALFYLEDCSYKEIAEILEVPMGTVKSRIARGIAQLQKSLAGNESADRARREPHE
jgi:RNA polymerase sigma-70 factor, ECF subfamily